MQAKSRTTAILRSFMEDAMVSRPALDPAELEPRSSSGYPESLRERVLPREKRALGQALGLKKLGINRTTLLPGKESSVRHFHTHEDEFVFVLEGELVLRTDQGEQRLLAGMCAGFPAGSGDAHQLINRSDRPARYLEIGSDHPDDLPVYPDDDLAAARCRSRTTSSRRPPSASSTASRRCALWPDPATMPPGAPRSASESASSGAHAARWET
jgi:uncharacterized cupin superfamily protein